MNDFNVLLGLSRACLGRFWTKDKYYCIPVDNADYHCYDIVMQFVVIGLDGTDSEAPARRQAVRQDHITMGDRLLENGNLWYGAALLKDDGSMKGSMYVVSFKSEKELQEWLDKEPYVVGKVWKDITIHKSNTRDPWQFNRSEEWFKGQE